MPPCPISMNLTTLLVSRTQARDAGRVLAVTDLVATLRGLLALGVERDGAEVDDLTIAESTQGIVGQPGDRVLGVGVESADSAADLVRRAAEAGAGGVVLRRSLARRRTVRDRARRSGVALVELAEQASWAHLVWLLRGVIDRAAVGPGRRDDAPVQDDLFALADAAAALVDAPVTIEDAQSRVLAYSSRQDVTDPARVSTIVGRRVPEEVLASLRARGVFRRLARSSEPVLVPADPSAHIGRTDHLCQVALGLAGVLLAFAEKARTPSDQQKRPRPESGASSEPPIGIEPMTYS